ncbi:MAG: hypothetical protein QOD78_2082 [Chloroflexota bacterium]|nr:hypothetical protein [Chloroflexota bacterium]
MAELQPVPNKPSPVAGREGTVAVLLGIALLVVIAKPWGTEADRAAATASPFPSHTAEPSTAADRDSDLQVALFGPFEPTPEWSIWPAGYFVSVMYVARAPRAEARPSLAPSASSPPGSEWPARIEVGEQDHLLWLGIDTPLGFKLETATLRRANADGTSTIVDTRRIPSPWPSHFSVVALPHGTTDTTLTVWPAGSYRLQLAVSPGDIRRTIEISIHTVPNLEPSPSATQR